MSRRKSITEVSNNVGLNEEDRDAIITLLVKRMCTCEEAVEYLLSAVLNQVKDDMLGELLAWDNKMKELKRIRGENQTLGESDEKN